MTWTDTDDERRLPCGCYTVRQAARFTAGTERHRTRLAATCEPHQLAMRDLHAGIHSATYATNVGDYSSITMLADAGRVIQAALVALIPYDRDLGARHGYDVAEMRHATLDHEIERCLRSHVWTVDTINDAVLSAWRLTRAA